MLILNNVSMNYGGRELFSEVTCTLQPKRRYGIVGANGCGKSTLLRILSGEEAQSGGTVDVANKGRIGFLKQDHFKYEHDLIVNVVLQGNPILWEAMHEKERLLQKLDLNEDDGMRLAHLEHIIAEQDGYVAETNAQHILSGLGIVESKHYEEMHILSGGFKLRVLLAQTLFSQPDILLLDEPTNDLDVETLRALEEALLNFPGCAMVISHDRWFLDRVVTHILAFEGDSKVHWFTGNYTEYEQDRLSKLGQDALQPHRVEYQHEPTN